MAVYALISVAVGAWMHGETTFEWLHNAVPNFAQIPETRIGRLFFLVMITGTLLVVIGVTAHIQDMHIDSIFSDLWKLFYLGRLYDWGHQWEYWIARVGALLAIAGYVLAYHYHRTIGRVVAWVRAGK